MDVGKYDRKQFSQAVTMYTGGFKSGINFIRDHGIYITLHGLL